jgi:hypothetical protein
MRGHGGPTDASLQGLLRKASCHAGPWPTISIWHGSADHTVSVSNVERILAQWRGVHELTAAPSVTASSNGHLVRTWRSLDGQRLVEAHVIAGMGHGTPIDARAADGKGVPGPFILDVGVSSTLQTANSWGIVSSAEIDPGPRTEAGGSELNYTGQLPEAADLLPELHSARSRSTVIAQHSFRVGKVIEDALRTAGLMQ